MRYLEVLIQSDQHIVLYVGTTLFDCNDVITVHEDDAADGPATIQDQVVESNFEELFFQRNFEQPQFKILRISKGKSASSYGGPTRNSAGSRMQKLHRREREP